MEKLKAAIIGLGRQAENDHIPGVIESGKIELKAVCDTDWEKVDLWSMKLGVKGYVNYLELLEKEDLDFVIIATPHFTHFEIVKECAKRKIHILKEKPLAMNLKEAEEMTHLCDENGVKLQVTMQRRFNPIYTTFFQLMERIGDPSYIEMKYTLYVKQPHEGWRKNTKTSGGGCILDMGYHMVDMLLWFFGLPEKIFADYSTVEDGDKSADVEDNAIVTFSYSKTLKGSLLISRRYPPKTEFIKVVGESGVVEIIGGKINRYNNKGEIIESLAREKAWPSAFSDQIDGFCNLIKGKENKLPNIKNHLDHLRFIEACYKSKKTNTFVNPKE